MRRSLLIGLVLTLIAMPFWSASRVRATGASSGPPVPEAGQPCPASVHDAITAPGPDGRAWPTWHPPVDEATGCYFGHEHGADPRTSRANAALPPFGHIGALVGDEEPHEGFKVFVVNRGFAAEGKNARADSRVVFHMGTSGVRRYTTRLHSLLYDYVHPDGRRLSLQGMADTSDEVGSTCDRPRKGGRDFSTIDCDDAYEIWSLVLKVVHPDDPFTGVSETRASFVGAVAVFDPITTRVPQDSRRVLYTEVYRNGPVAANPTSPRARYRGCARETYDGPAFWNNAEGRPTVYWTDAYGRVNPAGQTPGLLRQEISDSAGSVEAFKYRQDFCDPTVRAPN